MERKHAPDHKHASADLRASVVKLWSTDKGRVPLGTSPVMAQIIADRFTPK